MQPAATARALPRHLCCKRTRAVLMIQDQTSLDAVLPSNSQPQVLSRPPASSRDVQVMPDNFGNVFAPHSTVPCSPALQGSQEKPRKVRCRARAGAAAPSRAEPPDMQPLPGAERQHRRVTGTRQDANSCLQMGLGRDNAGGEDKGTKDGALGEHTSLPKLAGSRQRAVLPLQQHGESWPNPGGCASDAAHLRCLQVPQLAQASAHAGQNAPIPVQGLPIL